MPLKKGDRVAWSHTLPSIYGADSRLKAGAVVSRDPKAVFGTVVNVENEKGTLLRIKLDGGKIHRDAKLKLDDEQTTVLTSDEVIAITDEAPAEPSPAEPKKKGA